MAMSTTLMTFLIRTPPSTTSVSLYGSWDNFSRPYPMQRDKRLGPEYWSGCHSFDNIICDGRTDGAHDARRGGLKMGGTYWYYYKLDDEIEIHNAAEPSTTQCPLMPGQIVNVLSVPVALSGSRTRDSSPSSTSSERRTLDPAERFTNPRPVPSRPDLLRIESSPSVARLIDPSTTRVSNVPSLLARTVSRESLNESFRRHLPRKASLEIFGLNSSKSKTAGLRQSLRANRTDRSRSPSSRYKHIVDWKPLRDGKIPISAPQTPEVEAEEFDFGIRNSQPDLTPVARPLLLRNTSDATIATTSFIEHRRERSRSRSREPIPLINTIQHEDVSRPLLSTVQETFSPRDDVSSLQSAGTHEICFATSCPMTIVKGSELQLEKRLPTLPNTPSSAYPPSLVESPPRKGMINFTTLQSHFSTTTIDSDCPRSALLTGNRSRFSEWTTISDLMSPVSDKTIEDDLASPIAVSLPEYDPSIQPMSTLTPKAEAMISHDDVQPVKEMSSAFGGGSTTTISSATLTTSSSPHHRRPVETVYKRSTDGAGAHMDIYGGFQHYRLPEVDTSDVRSKQTMAIESEMHETQPDSFDVPVSYGNEQVKEKHGSTLHTKTMRQLLTELSYLGDAISQH